MVQFRWIKVSLFVMLLLPFTAVTGQNQPSFMVRAGDDVTLPCENVMKDQDKCDSTTWITSWKEGWATVELVNLGQIRNNLYIEGISNRLSVTEKCSLVIRNVTVDDADRYTCRQFNKSGNQQGPDSHVYLSVVNIEKQPANNSVTLNCAVKTYGDCEYTVKWLYDDDDDDDDDDETKTSPFGCSALMTFSPHRHQKSNNVLPKCEVRDKKSGETLLYHLSLEPSGNKTGNLWIIIVAVGLGALLIITVAVMMWKKSKGRETQMEGNMGQCFTSAVPLSAPKTSDDMADPEDGVSYASVNYTGKTRVCGDDEDVTVTYSTVKASSSSPAAASADLYATVTKPKTNRAAV